MYLAMRNRYIHSYKTHRVDAVSEENDTKILTIADIKLKSILNAN